MADRRRPRTTGS